MALLSTIFKIPIKSQIGFLKVDASLNENHQRTSVISDNEIEDGSSVTDHVKKNPESLSMECQISSNPVSILGLGVSTDDFLGAADDFLGGEDSAFEDLVKNDRRTPKEAWDYLNDIWKKSLPFSVVTSLQRYENMIITSLSVPRSAQNGSDLVFNIEMRKIRVVSSSVVLIPAFKLADPNSSASSKSDLGKQSGKGANEIQTDNSSLLLKGFKKAGIF